MIIGVTGTIGAGKSTVAGLLAKKTGFAVADADMIAKKILITKAKKRICKEFGTIDRKKIANIVFNDKKKLALLNKIIHPLVDEEIKKIYRKEKNLIVDAALLIEYENLRTDALIIVKSTKKEQMKRLENLGYKKSDALRRLQHQMNFSEKLKNAEKISKSVFVVKNVYIDETSQQVDKIIEKVVK